MSQGIIGIDDRMIGVFEVVADLFTMRLNKGSDVAEARRAIVAAIDMLIRDVDLPSAVLTDSGLWFPTDMTDDEKVALAGDLHPALRKRLPARVWKGLTLRS